MLMKKRFLSMFALLLMAATGAMAADGIECSASDKGKVLCTDGSIYAKVSDVPTGKTAAAMIVYIDMENKNGLALALSDEGSMTWSDAITACEGKSAVAGGTWVLPSKEQWEKMGALESGVATATALCDGFSSVGGTNMQSAAYWSSTANSTNANKAYRYYFTTGFYWENNVNKTENNYVRACLTFNILVAPPTYSVTLAEGTEDAGKWTISPAKAEEGATVTVTYNGEKKVKSVKAVKKAATIPVTSITLNKTATTISAGNTETLSVTAVAPDNATDKTYTWKTSNASIATVDQDGKVTAVAVGTVTIYAEANDGSGVKGNCEVAVLQPATITVTWNNDDITSRWEWENSFFKDGVTITAGHIDFDQKNFTDGGTFTTDPGFGNFTKIEVTTAMWDASGSGWSESDEGGIWTGNASSVSFDGSIMGMGQGTTTFVFTIELPN